MSDMRNSTPVMGYATGRPVRVQRSGNSKVLPVPADLGREAHIEVGESYVLELVGEGLLYRRVSPEIELVGMGANRIGVLSADQVIAAPQRSSAPPLDWDF